MLGEVALESALVRHFGHAGFRPGQREVVSALLAGRDVLGVLPNGAGKSLCYQLPALLLPRLTVVVTPLIALMKDQLDGLPPSLRQRATLINSQIEVGEAERRLAEVASSRLRLLYLAPERLRQRPALEALRRAGVSLFVVDEAHCLSLWGHDFRPDYLFLPKVLGEIAREASEPPALLALTATATPAIQAEIAGAFGRSMEIVNLGTHRPNLAMEIVLCRGREEKWKRARRLCEEEPGAVVVYTGQRQAAETLAEWLRGQGITAGHYHAGMQPQERERAQDAFMTGEIRVVVATIAFGMGIDKADVRRVIHLDLPASLESYYQEVGRAGRDGLPARGILLHTRTEGSRRRRKMRVDRLTIATALRLLAAVRQRKAAGESILQLDDLEHDLEIENTTLRVALSVLERAGALRRGCDVPQVFSLRWSGARGDQEFAGFLAGAHLRPCQRIPLAAVDLAAATGIPLPDLEAALLRWQERGWIEARGSARGLQLDLREVGPELQRAVQGELDGMAAAEERRLRALLRFLRSRRCRAQQLARYFGKPVTARCGRCDNCCPAGAGWGILGEAWIWLKRFWSE